MIKTEFLYEMQRFKKAYTAQFRALRSEYGLSQNEVDVLLFLANNPGHDTAKEIVEVRNLSKSHVSKSVENLGRLGYLRAEPDAEDRRCMHLILTSAAQLPVREAQRIQQGFADQLLEGISPPELSVVEMALEQIKQNMERIENHVV